MAKQAKEFILPLQLPLSENVHQRLTETTGGEPIAGPLTELIKDFLHHYTQGGFMITGSDIARMSRASGSTIDSSKKVLEAIDKVSGKKEGAHSFSVTVDPNMIGQLADVAQSRNMTLQDLIAESWDVIVASEWLYAVNPPCTQFIIGEQQREQLRQILGKSSFKGNEIVDALVKATNALAKASKE